MGSISIAVQRPKEELKSGCREREGGRQGLTFK
jgi:hypothetical protein